MAEEGKKSFIITLIGDCSVGKSTLLKALGDCHGSMLTRTLAVDGDTVELKIHETSGHRHYDSLTTMYHRIADGVLLVYDVTKRPTLRSLERWMSSGERQCPSMVKVVVGNKFDAVREVSYEEGKTFADMYSALYIEMDVRDKQLVEEAVQTVVQKIIGAKEPEMKSAPKEGMKLFNHSCVVS